MDKADNISSTFPDSRRKRIKAVVECCPNYIFHLLAVAEVGFSSDYSVKHKSSVAAKDFSFLQKQKSLLSINAGSLGELVLPMVFFPSYINLNSADALKEYFLLLDSCLQKDDFKPFLQRYSFFFEKLLLWFPIEEEYLRSVRKYRHTVSKVGRIYLDNYSIYQQKIWETEKEKLKRIASKINNHLENDDLIPRWEALTGKEFKSDDYNIILCSAIKNGPTANSLGYDRNIFYHDMPFDQMVQFISHETGTHILIGLYKEIASQNKYDSAILYGAYECLAKFYNSIILKDTNLEYDLSCFHEKEYLGIYECLYNENPNVPANDLLIAGIETFKSRHMGVN